MNKISQIEEVFPAYQEYMDAGVEWLGEVPATWDVRKLKYLIKGFESGVSVNSVDIPSKKHEKGILKTSSVYDYTFRPEENKTIVSEAELQRAKVSPRKGEIIISRMNTPDLVGASGYVNKDYPNLFLPDRLWQTVFHKGVEINSKWLSFFFVSKQFRGLLSVIAIGTSPSMKNISQDNFLNTAVPLPPLSEQRQIAHFLDHKTAQIDAALDKGRRLIELLREERAALINEAVTAGVDEHGHPRTKPTQLPAEGWKDSGVEWLGVVPEEWEVVKLKRIAEVRSGVTKSGAKKINDPVEIPYLRVANVQDGYLDLSNVSKIKIASRSIPNLLLQKGDLLMNEGGDNDKLGRGCIWNEEISPCTHQNHVFAVRPHPNINSKWLNAVTFTQYARNYFISNAKQSTNLASISSTSIKNLAIVLPSKIEQQRILRYIETETTRIDQKTTTMEQEIELLTEYRQALISEAVTGKIDVREVEVDG